MSWLHLQDLSAGEIWDSGSIACFSSVLEPAHLHHLLQFSLLLLTWFHDLPLLGDIRDFSLHSPPCACEYFHLPQGLWASLFAPHSYLLPAAERLCLWSWSLLRSPAFSFMGLLGSSPLTCLFSSVGSCYLSCLGCLCDFPDPGQDPPASFPLPRWWETPFYPAGNASQPKPSRPKLQTARWWGAPVYSSPRLCLGKPLGRKRPVCVILPPFSFQFNPLVFWEREQAFTCRRKEMKPQAVPSFVEDGGSRR